MGVGVLFTICWWKARLSASVTLSKTKGLLRRDWKILRRLTALLRMTVLWRRGLRRYTPPHLTPQPPNPRMYRKLYLAQPRDGGAT